MIVEIPYTFNLYNEDTDEHDIEVPTYLTFDINKDWERGRERFEINSLDKIFFENDGDEELYGPQVEQLADRYVLYGDFLDAIGNKLCEMERDRYA